MSAMPTTPNDVASAPDVDSRPSVDAIDGRGAVPWGPIRLGLTLLYLAGTLVATNLLARARGMRRDSAVDWIGAIPVNREIIVLWMLGLFLVNLAGRTRREWLVTLLSWAPFLLALFLYDFARSVGYRIHGNEPMMVVPQIRADELFGAGRLPTTILQERLYNPNDIRWYDVITSAVYTSHFLVPYLFAGYVWTRGQRLWRWYAGTFVGVNFFSCLIFAFVTTAPPWYAARKELIPEFERTIAGRGWSEIGLNLVSGLIDKGQQTVNPFAAIPSLHSAQAMIIVCFVWPFLPKLARPFLVLYPLWMTFALVYSGEHYFVDVLVGWAIVAGALWIGAMLRKRKNWISPFTEPRIGAKPTGSTSESLDAGAPVVPA
jgi:membrane-associated phospholipid phosphatase